MPIYEYQCCDCGNVLEAIQKFSDAPLKDCPKCGKPSLVKKVSAPAFRLKGGGWYETDFKTGNRKNIAGTAEGGDSKSGDSKSGESGKSGDSTKSTKSETNTGSKGKSGTSGDSAAS